MKTYHYPGQHTVCDACGEPIMFLNNNNTGTLAPITIASYPDGDCEELPASQYRKLGGKNLEAARAEERPLHKNHFSNCPNSKDFRRR